jgi:hypothetical protein
VISKSDLDAFDYRDVLTEEEIARAEKMTVDEVMEEGVFDLIQIGLYNGMDDDRVDVALRRIMDKLAQDRRSQFTVF